ncbi:hypothetical protein J6590_031237 [Homalodisca vitripennis]|nr:hypothetical protein J6590_031237 [Homalodisca vitripennis]
MSKKLPIKNTVLLATLLLLPFLSQNMLQSALKDKTKTLQLTIQTQILRLKLPPMLVMAMPSCQSSRRQLAICFGGQYHTFIKKRIKPETGCSNGQLAFCLRRRSVDGVRMDRVSLPSPACGSFRLLAAAMDREHEEAEEE